MMQAIKLIIVLLIFSISLFLGRGLIGECSSGGGMGAAYRSCECLGREWLLYDRTPSDGQIKSLCFGIITATVCHQYIDGPVEECDFRTKVTLSTDKEMYAVGENIKLTLTNNLSSPIRYYDICSLHLCQYQSDEWYCETQECHAATIVLEAGSAIELTDLAITLVGTRLKYRFEYQTFNNDTLYTIESNEFTIQPD